ncbi:hypothetical protein ACEPAG_3724 [Sanghuangporus baumii]
MFLSGAKILSLPDELLVELVSRCSLGDVLHLEATCRRLYRLCNNRQIWVDLLQSLDIDCAPDVPPQVSMELLSLVDLREKVKDAVTRCQAWKNPDKLQIFYDLVLRVPLPDTESDVHSSARLLPGGAQKYLLISNSGRLELWCLRTLSRIWNAPLLRGRNQCTSFDFELETDGKFVTIVGEFISPEETATYLRVLRYGFEEHSAELVYEICLPYTNLFRLTVKNRFCIAFLSSHFQTLLVDWRKREGVFLDFVDSKGNSLNDGVRCLHIYDNHLLAAGRLPSGFSLVALQLSTLDGHWSSSSDYRSWQTLRCDAERACALNLSQPDGETCWMLTSRVFTPTWKKASTEMYIVAYSGSWDSPKLLSFRIHLDTSNGYLNPKLKNAIRAPTARLPWDPHCISNSGQVFCVRNALRCFSLFSEAHQPLAELDMDMQQRGDCEPTVTIEPWSGAIIAYVGRTVMIFKVK